MRTVVRMAQAKARAQQERSLLTAVARGDRRAFTELYRRYQPRLHGYLRRLLRDPASIEEIVDDVLFVVWTDARKFRGSAAVSSWIFGIAYRKAMSSIRSESRHHAALDRTVDPHRLADREPYDPELLRAALAELSADHRQVVELTYFCGFSYREIADIAGCPVNTVKTRMYHARRRLRYLMPLLAGDGKEQRQDHA